MKTSIIVAASLNNVIGKDNKLPWRLKDDMKHFVEVTKGKAVLMGRKTLDSLPGVLPNRRNYVLTRNSDYKTYGAVDVFNNIEKVLEYAKVTREEEIVVIGGEEIYRQMLPLADRVYMTRVYTDIEGDAFWPQELFDADKDWDLVEYKFFPSDIRNEYPFYIQTWDRVKQQKQ